MTIATDTQEIKTKKTVDINTFSTHKLSGLISKTEKEVNSLTRELERETNKLTKKLDAKKDYLAQLKQAISKNDNKPLPPDEIPICQELRAKFKALSQEQQKQIADELENLINNCDNDEL